MNSYDRKYDSDDYYWGKKPSVMCERIVKLHPPGPDVTVLDIGCGEGRNAVYLARQGYTVSAFDISRNGIDKTLRYAEEADVQVEAFKANINEYRLGKPYDILFATGSLHYMPPEIRDKIFANYRRFTRPGGLNAFSVFVTKPFIEPAPDAEPTAHPWKSGELFMQHHDRMIEFCDEEIFDCNSGGVPHRHAVNRMIARKVEEGKP